MQRSTGLRLVALRLLHAEAGGELVLLMIVGGFFAYMLWESRDWPVSSWLMPRFAIALGAPLWVIRVVGLVRYAVGTKPESYQGVRREEDTGGQIMDLGFYLGDDAKAALRRFTVAVGSLGALIVFIWILGWHVGLPLWTTLYLRLVAQVKLWQAVLGGLFFVAVVTGLYGALFGTTWNDPLLFAFVRWLVGII